MTREVGLVILGLVVGCGGFTIRSTAQRWKPDAGRLRAIANNSSSCSNGGRHCGCYSAFNLFCGRGGRRSRHHSRSSSFGTVQMSIGEMIGADVESGGLFDPLGERQQCFSIARCSMIQQSFLNYCTQQRDLGIYLLFMWNVEL